MLAQLQHIIQHALHRQNAIIEGYYGGDFLESHVYATQLYVPDPVTRITQFDSSWDLYDPETQTFSPHLRPDSILEIRRLAPFSPRTILVADGRIYHRPELRTPDHAWTLDNLLEAMQSRGGFDTYFTWICDSARAHTVR